MTASPATFLRPPFQQFSRSYARRLMSSAASDLYIGQNSLGAFSHVLHSPSPPQALFDAPAQRFIAVRAAHAKRAQGGPPPAD